MKILCLLLLFASTTFAQAKKEYFLDETYKVLSKQAFLNKRNYKINIDRRVENDTAIIHKLYLRNSSGQLNPTQADSLRTYVGELLGRPVYSSKILVINYYSGLDDYYAPPQLSQWNIYDRDYLKKLNRIASVEQLYVYKFDENLRYHHGRKLQWYFDNKGLIEKTFFPLHFLYGGFAIIHPNGKYHIHYGEYGKQIVWEHVQQIVIDNGN